MSAARRENSCAIPQTRLFRRSFRKTERRFKRPSESLS